ncbi:MAG: hypothetical protein CL565_01340 [Alphaproteobacteria bacterium]|nr:hypothetical protein [Alphaproteobacteria bacterium]|tara:strand:- start:73 stop:420 length:348 start_codon:yes stop_codon:yes gene_type:complete
MQSKFKNAAEAQVVSMDEVIDTLRQQEDNVKIDNPYSGNLKEGEWCFQPPEGCDAREIELARTHNAHLLARKMKELGVENYQLFPESNLVDDIHEAANLKSRIMAKSGLKVSNSF